MENINNKIKDNFLGKNALLIATEKSHLKALIPINTMYKMLVQKEEKQDMGHLKSLIEYINANEKICNVLLDCFNLLKNLSLKNKILVLELLTAKLLMWTEQKALVCFLNIDILKNISRIADKANNTGLSNTEETLNDVNEFAETLREIYKMRFNEKLD